MAALQSALEDSGYRAEAVAEARRAHRFLPTDEEISIAAVGGDARGTALVRLLALGQHVALPEARNALSPARLEDLQATGLLTVEANRVIANYCLLPHDGLLIAGDRPGTAEREMVHAYTEPSKTLARLTPRTPRRSMLDLGTGSGVLALLGASHCDRVTAVDINPRALTIARFNSDLNDVDNVELLEGSWFEPVAGRQFDLIVGNPPYVISPDQEFTYRDSGLPSGVLLDMVCQDAAAHLEAGGLAIFLCSWPHQSEDDWAAAPTAAVSGTGCDALILRQRTVDALDHAVSWNAPPARFLPPESFRETVAHWLSYYGTIGAEMISFGAIVLRRRESGEPWVSTLKAGFGGERASEQVLGILRGQDRSHSLDDPTLLATRFSLPPGVDVSQRFERRRSGFVARPAMVSLDDGLGARAAIDPDALDVLFACDGTRTLREAVEGLAQRRGLGVDALAEIAATAVRELLAHGLLDIGVDGYPPSSS